MKTSPFDIRMENVKRLTPKTGFNVVAVDTFESDPSCELYLVAHCATLTEAEAIASDRRAAIPIEPVYVYPAVMLS